MYQLTMLLDMHSVILYCFEVYIGYESSLHKYTPIKVEGTASIFFELNGHHNSCPLRNLVPFVPNLQWIRRHRFLHYT